MTTIRLLASAILLWTAASAAGEPVATFAGRDGASNLTFSVDGPWKLVWRLDGSTEFPGLTQFEAKLVDAATGRPLGTLARRTGSARGVRYVDGGGRFAIDVAAREARWKLEVVALPVDWESVAGFENVREVDRFRIRVLDRGGEGRLGGDHG